MQRILKLSKACCHFRTRIEKHNKKDSKSHNVKHLHSTTTRFDFDSHNYLSFKKIDKANSKVEFKFKEALIINWTKPKLIAKENHLAVTLSL